MCTHTHIVTYSSLVREVIQYVNFYDTGRVEEKNAGAEFKDELT